MRIKAEQRNSPAATARARPSVHTLPSGKHPPTQQPANAPAATGTPLISTGRGKKPLHTLTGLHPVTACEVHDYLCFHQGTERWRKLSKVTQQEGVEPGLAPRSLAFVASVPSGKGPSLCGVHPMPTHPQTPHPEQSTWRPRTDSRPRKETRHRGADSIFTKFKTRQMNLYGQSQGGGCLGGPRGLSGVQGMCFLGLGAGGLGVSSV